MEGLEREREGGGGGGREGGRERSRGSQGERESEREGGRESERTRQGGGGAGREREGGGRERKREGEGRGRGGGEREHLGTGNRTVWENVERDPSSSAVPGHSTLKPNSQISSQSIIHHHHNQLHYLAVPLEPEVDPGLFLDIDYETALRISTWLIMLLYPIL